MKARFLHLADCHLGYRQYNNMDRYDDFARAFWSVIDTAIEERVDFVLLAGDLFHKRAIDALTLNQAMYGLERLAAAKIPCIAVEGNHEHAYFNDSVGWMQFLAMRGLLTLLSPEEFEEGKPLLQPYQRYTGAYIDPLPGLRVYGMRYYGAGTSRAIEGYAEALSEVPKDGVEYTIFMTHAGVEGVLGDEVGGISYRQLSVLQPHADYVALGHVHKPFEMDGWIHNPGSTETCTTQEAQWRERGYYVVEVDTSRKDAKHIATLCANPRRPFERISVKVDLHTSPDGLCDYCRELVARKARDLRIERRPERLAPVVEVQLTGVLAFDRSALDLNRLEQIVADALSPLHVLMRNLTRATEFEVESAAEVSRPELERRVLGDLFARDARFRERSGLWTRTALSMKRLAIEGAAPDAVVEELEHRIEEIDRSLERGPLHEPTQRQEQGQSQKREAMSHADPVG